jgi:hypothetical protein
MPGDLYSETPWGAELRGQVFPIPVEIRAGVECAEWNQQRALQDVAEEWEVRGIYMTKWSGPKAMWLIGRKRQLTVFFLELSPVGRSGET